jgi:CheY-like chemotaxis protein
MQWFEQGLILVVDDREDDILMLKRAFTKAKVLNPIQVARSGEEAIAYLKGEGRFANRTEFPLPHLLLLDLKMPGLDGFDVIRWVKSQPELKALRIVVLTSSDAIIDVNLAYQLGANSFLVKPVEFQKFVEVSQAIHGYWLWLSKAPQVERPSTRPVSEE